jgi:AcrR family transcriptional regulator
VKISAQAKIATRQRILKTATALFQSEGWKNTTTRNIASAAGIAVGTLFNYFPAKEAIAAALISDAFQTAASEFSAEREERSLDADLFSLIWSFLVCLHPYRGFLGPACETLFSPLASSSPSSPGDAIRIEHLKLIGSTIAAHGFTSPISGVAIQLYWTLFLGILAFWAADESPGQEDTLALLDHSLKLYVASPLIQHKLTHEKKENQ